MRASRPAEHVDPAPAEVGVGDDDARIAADRREDDDGEAGDTAAGVGDASKAARRSAAARSRIVSGSPIGRPWWVAAAVEHRSGEVVDDDGDLVGVDLERRRARAGLRRVR